MPGTAIPDSQCATIPILDDLQVEGDHDFDVSISATSHGDVIVGTQSTTTVTITDNEGVFNRGTVLG